MMFYIHLPDFANQAQTPAAVRRLAAQGVITKDTLVWQDGSGEWRPAEDFPEFWLDPLPDHFLAVPATVGDAPVKCPKCSSTQVHAEKRGWSLATGFIRSGQILVTCLKCGAKFKPGQGT